MTHSASQFGELLTQGIYAIRARNGKSLAVIQDELAYMLGKAGQNTIEYWRQGHIPSDACHVAGLAREIVTQGSLDIVWLTAFLESAGYDQRTRLLHELFPIAINFTFW